MKVYFIPTRVKAGYKYKNALEQILNEYYNLTMDENNYIYINDCKDREVINSLLNFKRFFNVVYWGKSKGLNQYKIIITDMEGLNKIHNNYIPAYKTVQIPCTKEEYEAYLELENCFSN